MKKTITVNGKEYEMPKMSVDTYMQYLDLAEQMEKRNRYTKQDIEAILLFLCTAYGNQFTEEELKDPETGLDAAGVIVEFQFIEMGVAQELEKKIKQVEKNFTTCK